MTTYVTTTQGLSLALTPPAFALLYVSTLPIHHYTTFYDAFQSKLKTRLSFTAKYFGIHTIDSNSIFIICSILFLEKRPWNKKYKS